MRTKLLKVLALIALSGCAAPVELIAVPAQPVRETRFYASQLPGARISLQMALPEQGFVIKGHTLQDVKSLKFYLVANNTGTQTPLAGPFVWNINSFANDGDFELFSFHNIQPGSYYVAVSAYDAPDGGGRNLTAHHKDEVKVRDDGDQHVYESKLGGLGGANPGKFTVNPDYTIAGTMPLTVQLEVEH